MGSFRVSLPFVFLVLVLSGCGTLEVTQSQSGYMTVTSDQGTSLNGGWSHASAQATKKATEVCAARGEIPFFFNESRGGVPGWSKLSSSISFKCGPDVGQGKKATTERYRAKLKNDSELTVLESKVELFRESRAPIPFVIASNNAHPTADEAKAIAKWAQIREEYIRETDELNSRVPSGGGALREANHRKLLSFQDDIAARVADLIVALYSGKLSYGEFARKRQEVSIALQSASDDFQRAVLEADRDAQLRQQSLAEQQRANSLAAWSTYMQSVNSRPSVLTPQPAQPLLTPNPRLQTNCTSQRIGNTVTTNCN